MFGPERLMTSLDMKGLSVSVLPVDEATLRALSERRRPARMAARSRAHEDRAVPDARARWTDAVHVPSAEPTRRRVVETIVHHAHRAPGRARRARRQGRRRRHGLDVRDGGARRARRSRRAALRRRAGAVREHRRAALHGDGRLERDPPLDRRLGDGRVTRARTTRLDGGAARGPTPRPAVRRRERRRSDDARRALARRCGARGGRRARGRCGGGARRSRAHDRR